MADRVAAFSKFWRLYRAYREEIIHKAAGPSDAMAAFWTNMSGSTRALFSSGLDQAADEVAAARNLSPVAKVLHAFGVEYARANVSYADVFETLFRVRDAMLALIAPEDPGNDEVLRGLLAYFDLATLHITSAYHETRDTMLANQRARILELSLPVLQIAPRVLLVPLIGDLTADMEALTARVLEHITAQRARLLVLDLTGVAELDHQAAAVIGKLVATSQLMGARVVVCGLSSALAQAITDSPVGLDGAIVCGDLAEAIEQSRS